MFSSSQQTSPPTFAHTPESLLYAVVHVFSLADFSWGSELVMQRDFSLARAMYTAAHAYTTHIDETSRPHWSRIRTLLEKFQLSGPSDLYREHVISQLRGMQTGDLLAFFALSDYGTGILLTKMETCTRLETFNVSLDRKPGICSYPASAVEVPTHVLDNPDFQVKFADFFSYGSHLSHAQFVASLHQDILPSDIHTANVPLITKHLRGNTSSDWCRSPCWLFVKAVVETSLDRSPLGHTSYKAFMLFLMCNLANDANIHTIYSDLLLLMGHKIQRRMVKLGSSLPEWLSRMALSALSHLSAWSSPPPFRNPSQDELERDTRLSLTCSEEYIRNALANQNCESLHTTFPPRHCLRGTIYDFLSSNGAFFDEAYGIDPNIALHDFEKAVEEDIDDWIVNVVNVDDACNQLMTLMDRYCYMAHGPRVRDALHYSIMLLTAIDLFIALDKLVVKEIPLLVNYSPEVPAAALEKIVTANRRQLHRLSCAYQYLSARQSQSRMGWSMLSDEESLPVCYYNQCLKLQQLKVQIEKDSPSPLPASPLQAKVVVFELQCPLCIRVWRSAAARMWYCFQGGYTTHFRTEVEEYLLCRASVLRQYYVDSSGPFQVDLQFSYFYPVGSQSNPSTFCYAIRHKTTPSDFWTWEGNNDSAHWEHWWFYCIRTPKYASNTSHTANDVLAAQVNCSANLSLDEFVTFGQLRSGSSLQWLNILHGLRSRALNLRNPQVHRLISCTVAQVGPLDLNTGRWLWHEELNGLSFCNVFLDEIESLTKDIKALVIDSWMMKTISSLLTRLLGSSPSKEISQRAVALLRRVRRKMLDWVYELAYNLGEEPTYHTRKEFLADMSDACLKTFDVDITDLPKHFQSTEDINAALSCTILTNILVSDLYCFHISIASENVLSDAILSDATDRGVDRAIRIFFPSHKPGASKWVKLSHPNTGWFVCPTRRSADKPSKTVQVSLLKGEIWMDGQSMGILYNLIHNDRILKTMSADQGFFVLPHMDPMNEGMMPKQKVHIYLRDGNLTVRVHYNDSKDILEWIPDQVLTHDLPPPLLDNHIHWLNLTKGILEIRPRERPLDPSPEDWRISCASGEFRAYRGNETLVDIRSSTWAIVSHCFKGLNIVWRNQYRSEAFVQQSNNLLMTTSPTKSSQPILQLSVLLASHGLSFFVNDQGELESCDFEHMVYDRNPQIETLPGIAHLFVLKQKSDLPEGVRPKRILVPDANPSTVYHGNKSHMVWFSNDGSRYHDYIMDSELGCLVSGNGSLTSTRQLAFMHALTSQDDRPDPFTGKTGVQAAVSLLRSGRCRSIARFKFLEEDSFVWVSDGHPEVDVAYWEIQDRYYWRPKAMVDESVTGTASDSESLSQEAANFCDGSESTWLPPPFIFNIQSRTGAYSSEQTAKDFTKQIPEESENSLSLLFFNRPAPSLPPRRILPRVGRKSVSDNPESELNRLFPLLEVHDPCSSLRQKYIARLSASALHFHEESCTTSYSLDDNDRIDTLKKHYVLCRTNYFKALETLNEALCGSSDLCEHAVSQWPSVTGNILLRYLASASVHILPDRWKKRLVSLALLLLDLQRARRLLQFALDGLEDEFSKELENEGCDGWDPEEYPDWLLIQIEGNFLIRRRQAEVAMEMMSPKSGQNSVMQMNMGEGKSSVIIPIVAAALADGKQLVRVVVPKSLTAQMFDLLVSRLGGLVNRPIYHLPFSRIAQAGLHIDNMQNLMSQCMAERGILLMQPEHVVSLRLMCMERQICSGKPSKPSNVRNLLYEHVRASLGFSRLLSEESIVGSMLQQWCHRSRAQQAITRDEHSGDDHNALGWMNLQKWMDSHVRDILDESDEILHSRFKLIYTIGLEQHMEGYPDRWTITQQVLHLVNECGHALARNYPDSFQIESGPPGSFPHIGTGSGSDIGRRLKPLLVEYVMAGRIRNLSFHDLPRELRDAIHSFISDEDILPDTAKRVEAYAERSAKACMWSALLLLRGLLASNILLFAMERRWRVDYGLDFQSSSMLAVPYRAKDMLAPKTQFGHPDITVILTCLSYYYSGLNDEQLRRSLQLLLDQDDPHAEYAFWVKDHSDDTLPESLRTLCEINLRSSEQWDKDIYPLFFRNQAAIDLYLSQVVFPREAKEFTVQLSASSWDLAGKREKVITGFSGTDDGQWLLPMPIDQHDLGHQLGSNARVLADLLRPHNDFYIISAHESGERWTTYEFLQTVTKQQPEIHVLLDVGAQILDYSNHEVAKAWLDIDRNAAGAVYFDDKDELNILARNRTSVPMLSSSLSQQLGRCVIYLDHAHTRGTDLKLPMGSRAAVTLGPRLTKDNLVQGCMRMRKLGGGHSVMFFAPPEVDMTIRSLKKDASSPITTADILCWAIHETWVDIQERAPYWAQQGMDHRSRDEAWSRFSNKAITSKQLSDVLLQPAAKSLEDLYAPHESKQESTSTSLLALDSDIRQRCRDLGVTSLSCVQIDEQEREVDQEREREWEAELPPNAKPAKHFLHPDVVNFLKTGVLPALYSSSAFRPVFTTLEKSSAATREADVWSPFILATTDFCNTIKPDSTKGTIDQYLRPVQWVVSSERDKVLVLMSPFEVNLLIEDFRESEDVHLHMYAPRRSRHMKPSDDLKLYTIPPLPSDWSPPLDLIDQLNMFSGQLYLRDYQSYLRVCRFLGAPTEESPSAASKRRNMLNLLFGDPKLESEGKFSRSPLPFVFALLAIRNRGQPFAHTHMGKILYGQVLKEKDFEALPSVAPRRQTLDVAVQEESPCTPVRPRPMALASYMDVDQVDRVLGRSGSLSLYKRKLEGAEICEGDSVEPQSKRSRSD